MKWYGYALVLVAGLEVAQAAPLAGGPSGGRLLDSSPRAEFLVNPERKVEIRFVDEHLKLVPAAGQVVGIIAEAPAGKSRLDVEPREGALVTTTPLPEGDGYTVVVQIRATADAKPQNFRVPLQLEPCGDCQRAEYACTCESHAEDAGHGP
ncbi:MAG: hypothetical protein K8T26_06570 [Lentisphaerae bacterium]|nr:hypothetical protein [Lentisphaerota bacterium]